MRPIYYKTFIKHKTNERNNDRYSLLRLTYGMEGYGIYWAILEILSSNPAFVLSTKYEIIAFDLRVDVDKIKTIVEDYNLFSFSEDKTLFYSEAIMKKKKNILDKTNETPQEISSENVEFLNFQQWIKKNAPNVALLSEPFTLAQFIKIKNNIPPQDVKNLLEAMHNKKTLLKKYTSAYLTLINWYKRNFNANNDSIAYQPENDQHEKQRKKNIERTIRLSKD